MEGNSGVSSGSGAGAAHNWESMDVWDGSGSGSGDGAAHRDIEDEVVVVGFRFDHSGSASSTGSVSAQKLSP